MARNGVLTGMLAALIVSACDRAGNSSPPAAGAAIPGTSIAVPPPAGVTDGEWSMPARDYANSRFSNLSQITPANAKIVHVSWTFSTGVLRGHSG